MTATVPPQAGPPKGRFTAAFLARLLYEKYVLGLPPHRVAKALAAEGLEVTGGIFVRGAEGRARAAGTAGAGDRP
ncbi:MAG TPA: transposase [Mycobacteriales bacterium]|nr:transposase [Mycobacteriales bacterium]